ncbi:hypothetical protein [Pelagibius sp.]|uniref:hypothetical protein n=1 Tax=Pelagibius sp. TaxID=1931238 RepID=UPI00262B9885|nr:hypothetical protein [Pelagibius sp.]
MADAVLAVAFLRSHGIWALAHFWHTVRVHWHWTHACGGVAVQVPAPMADRALDLMADFQAPLRPKGLWWRLLVAAASLLALIWAGVPPPASGFYGADRRTVALRLSTPLREPS